MKAFKNIFLAFAFLSTANLTLAQGGNTCGAAATLTVNGTCGTGTVTNTTISGSATICGATAKRETWYKFTIASTTNIDISVNANKNSGIQLISGTCGSPTEVACENTNTANGAQIETMSVTSLAAGTYFVRVVCYQNANLAITDICITSPAAALPNDNCSGATAFGAIPTNGSTVCLNNQSTATATNSNVTPTGACTSNTGTPDDDVWFKFVATSTAQILTASYDSGSSSDIYWQVFSGSCSGTMTSLLCTDNNTGGTVGGLTIGNTYFVRMYTYWSGDNAQYDICMSSAPPGPANDNPCGALTATVNSDLNCGVQTAGTVASATATGASMGGTPTCYGTADDDVWFKFTATSTTHYVDLNNVAGSVTDMYHSIYSGTCASIGSPIKCSDANNSITSGLTIGNVYYIRVYTYTGTGGQNTTFNVCVGSPPAPPANDNPCAASPVTVNPALVCTSQTAGTVAGATATGSSMGTSPTCYGTADDDVWFSFVATNTTQFISLNNVTGSTTDMYHSVYSGACGSVGTPIKCSDSDNSTLTGLTVGNTYFIRAYTYTSTAGQNTNFNVCVTTPPPPPANDACGNATAMTVNADFNCGTQTAGTISSATASGNGLGTCNGTADDDVWFTFVATGTSHSVGFNNATGSTTDLICSVYSGACNSLTQLNCNEWYGSGSSTLTGLTAGNTYRVRVFSWSSSSQTANFNMCVGTPPPPPANDDCPGATAFGAVPTDGSCVSLTGSTASATNSLVDPTNTCTTNSGTPDDDVWFSFVASATTLNLSAVNVSGNTDVYWQVFRGNCGSSMNSILCTDNNSGGQLNGLTVGNTYRIRMYSYYSGDYSTETICLQTPPPPPPNGNCAGMIEFCPSNPVAISAVTGTTAQSGNNYGCLGSQPNPYWYYFTANQAGNLNLDLNAASDVDFALWGPYSNLTAANSACGSYPAPIDCSYSTTNIESIDVAAATVGQVYVLMVTNYANVSQNISLAFDTPSSTGDCNCTPLGVKLSNFEVNAFGTKNYVNWTTSAEVNNDYFLVQKSIDGTIWETLKLVKGHGNSSKIIEYEYIDERPSLGLTYYRLKQYDFDGNSEYSELKSVTRKSLGDFTIYPQPVVSTFKISSDIGQLTKIEIIDILGKKSIVDFKAVNDEYEINIEKFKAGLYVLNLYNNEKVISTKVVKN